MGNSNKRSKGYLIAVLVIFILALAAGYAAFVDTLTITGTANAKGNFDLKFTECEITGAVGVNETNTTAEITQEGDLLTVNVADLSYPGAGVQFDTVITNVGTVPAKVKAVTPTNVTGSDNILIEGLDAIDTDHKVIPANGTCEFSFTVQWDPASEADLSAGENVSFGLVIEYEQDTTEVFEGSASHQDA
ncbi:MAG: hypothetical protein IKK43_02370 [Clostridia bacterium]|nr:hypothetical protein [Clostridia bacterium]